MSDITKVIIYNAVPAEVVHLNAWMAKEDKERQQQFMRLNMDDAGGTKLFYGGVWAAALNCAPSGLFEKLADPKTWPGGSFGMAIIVHGEESYRTITFDWSEDEVMHAVIWERSRG